jgi:hypothetical protein
MPDSRLLFSFATLDRSARSAPECRAFFRFLSFAIAESMRQIVGLVIGMT